MAHDLTAMTARAENEAYVKSQLRERMDKAKQVIVIVGESTKNLRKFVAWEIDLAKEKGLPVIVVNLKSGQRQMDFDLCPASSPSSLAPTPTLAPALGSRRFHLNNITPNAETAWPVRPQAASSS